MEIDNTRTEICVGGRYHFRRKIGGGSFGDLYLGEDDVTKEKVAIKLEPLQTKHPQLAYEYKLYRVFSNGVGIPQMKWFGKEGDYNVLVMDLLGPSLEDLFNYCDRKFSVKTVLMLADHMISRIEFVHLKNFIHRDIKPDNFLMGRGDNASRVHVIDFGLAKKYRDPSTHNHIPYRENKSLIGTARYVSVNTHLGYEQSRRDDMESLGYVFMYFLRGSLPWQGIKANNRKKRYDEIHAKKMKTSIEELCAGYPKEFNMYMTYVKNLKFDERPDYAYLRKLFRDLFFREGHEYDLIFDWTIKKFSQNKTKL